jgi:hypothetical protein
VSEGDSSQAARTAIYIVVFLVVAVIAVALFVEFIIR